MRLFRSADLAMGGMSDRVAQPRRFGFGARWNWLFGGFIGGVVGAILFGAIVWVIDPDIIVETIPALYGLESGPIGWGLHVAHGALLGVIFGFIITRQLILGTLGAHVETEFIAEMGLRTRIVLAGFVYGIAVWTALPLVAQTIWAAGGLPSPGFPFASIEILIGHIVFGVLLGLLFSIVVDIGPAVERAEDPFEEAPVNQGH